jgi:hypothetical protein
MMPRMFASLIPLVLAGILMASPAEAGPVIAAIGAIATTVGTFLAGTSFLSLTARLLLSVALSALQRALLPKPREPGIKTKVTQTGGTNPAAFPLLKYATAGTHVCPPMTHGRLRDTPNAYLTYVVLLSDVPGCTLSRVLVNGQYVTIAGTINPSFGRDVLGEFANYMWVRFYDGSQTVADPDLMTIYGAAPERPWQTDMIGRGCAYAIVTFLYNRSKFPGLPRLRFELNGIPLYDPRKDTTVGGSGAHRWANKATWEPTENPVVATYNIMRGISLTDGSIWGGNFAEADLPLSNWFAAMNECDLSVFTGVVNEPQFRAGFEVSVDEEPADVIEELMKACMGRLAEIGGVWKIRVGPPGVPVLSITDGDTVITSSQEFRPFPNFAASYNGAHASYPSPAAAWESKDASPVYNATYEAEDQGQRLIANLNLVAVPYPAQVRRIMRASVEEERRFRRHELTLPPDAAILEPLDAISWTSAENGYTTKVFEIDGVTDDLQTLLQNVMLREVDAADYSYPALPPPDDVSTLPVVPATWVIPGFAVAPRSIPDPSGTGRRPGLLLTWPVDLDDVTTIQWQVRVLATGTNVAQGSAPVSAGGGFTVAAGLIANTAYEARILPVADRPVTWTAWVSATTPNLLVINPDIAKGAVTDEYQEIALGPFAGPALPINTVIASLSLGANGNGEIWERRIHFTARPHNVTTWEMVLERRIAQLGGGFGAWTVLETFNFPAAAGVPFAIFSDAGNLAEPWDNFQYRLRVSIGANVTAPALLKDVYLTVARVTK